MHHKTHGRQQKTQSKNHEGYQGDSAEEHQDNYEGEYGLQQDEDGAFYPEQQTSLGTSPSIYKSPSIHSTISLSPSPSMAGSEVMEANAELVFNRAARAQHNANEAQWSTVVDIVLADPSHTRNPFLEARNVSTYNIERSLVPVDQNGDPLRLCRVDFLLKFNDSHASVRQLIQRYPDTQVSVLGYPHGLDGAVSFLPIEVKALSGNYPSALYQILVHSAAIVTLWVRLRDQANARQAQQVTKNGTRKKKGKADIALTGELPPTPSVVVVGHQWYLNWAYYEDDEVIHIGPFDMGNTLTMIGTLKVFANVRKLKNWAEHGIGRGDRGVWERFTELVEAANA
ncbi:hypothetical protein DFH27DRAFT_622973 [Peziza echinospora]|nr:hypothetical protein DFH27DRAFT_622973 [Peziza echinospora]